MNQVDEKIETLQLPLTGLDKAFAKYLQEAQPSSDPHHERLAALTSYQFGRGHACLDLELLAQRGVAALGWDSTLNALLNAELTQSAALMPWISGQGSPLVLEGTRLYLRRNWNAEQSIRAAIDARMRQACDVPDNLSELLDALFPKQDAVTGPRESPVNAPDWQKVACAMAARKRLTLITGGPGTGKTTTVVRLLALLQSSAKKDGRALRVALAAPTGKAAARLGESIATAIDQVPPEMRPEVFAKAVTLHKLLQIRPNQVDAASPGLAVDLVIVDEASMIDLEMMSRLLAAVPLTASLILLGDKDQLASVEAGAVMAQLCEGSASGRYTPQTVAWIQSVTGCDLTPWSDETGKGGMLAQQTVMLRFSRRFKDDSSIGLWAKAVNAGDVPEVKRLWRTVPEYAVESGAVVDSLQCTTPHDARLGDLARIGWVEWLALMHALRTETCTDERAVKVLKAFAQFQVLCAVREGPWGVELLNQRIAQSLGFKDDGWYAGRPVMVTRNDYNLSLMNGDVGLCLPHANGLRVAFPDGQGGIHWVLPSRLDGVESVFAMTVHKSQGSEFEHVCLVLPNTPVAVLTRELLYTGITRSKTRLTFVVPELAVLWRTVECKVLRSGGLGQRSAQFDI
jgi:exodeoxyribonuclease V alpha subunit